MPDTDHKAELTTRVVDAVQEMHAEATKLGPRHFFSHRQYPSLRSHFKERGMPSFFLSSGPPDYRGAVGPAGGLMTRMEEESLPAFQALLGHVRESAEVRDRVLFGYDWGDYAESVLHGTAARLAGSVLERLMHGGFEASPEVIVKLYLPLEQGLFVDERAVEVLVPLICVACDSDEFALADDVRLERMNEETQLARMALSNWGSVQEVVLGAATHALVVSGGVSRPVPFGQRQNDDLPRQKIDKALQALRIVSHQTFGHAQLVVRPIGWASRYTTTLPPLEYAVVERRYPPSLDDYGWLREPARISRQDLDEARTVYEGLDTAPLRVRQAARRIDRAQMRDDLDDAVVDYCIGLESLLDDGSQTETTHKCALRAAAVLAATDNLDPAVVFKAVKKAYGLRSAIVHGHSEQKVAKLRTFEVGGTPMSITVFVQHIVHRLVFAMLSDKKWTDPSEVDRHLLDSLLRSEHREEEDADETLD